MHRPSAWRRAGPSLPAAKALFDPAAAILGYDLLGVCVNGPAERLNATDVSQPAIFVASLAALEQLKTTEPDATDRRWSPPPGLSLGEYTALVFAGAMTFDDGLKVVQARGRAMQAAAEATPSGMVSVLGLEIPEVEALVVGSPAAGHARSRELPLPRQHGRLRRARRDRTGRAARREQGRHPHRPAAVAGAFHTDLMKPADEQLAAALAAYANSARRVPVWSNVDAKPHTDPAEIRALLVGRCSRRCGGRRRCGGCSPTASNGSTRSARAGCWRAAEAGEPQGGHPERHRLTGESESEPRTRTKTRMPMLRCRFGFGFDFASMGG